MPTAGISELETPHHILYCSEQDFSQWELWASVLWESQLRHRHITQHLLLDIS